MRRVDDKIFTITLPSGLRLVHRKASGAVVDYCGVVIKAGSRDDDINALGTAHFVEHTIFKGTQRRQSWHIINRMERIGGELNAYTTKEETVVYTAAPAGNMHRAMELIADLIINSRFPSSELDKEREVVLDEINSYLDSPSEAVYDDFEDIIYAGTPLGHNILGNEKHIRNIDSRGCRGYLDKWYTAPNMVVFYSGALSFERVKSAVAKYFESLPTHQVVHKALSPDFEAPHFDKSHKIGSHQAHTVMGGVIGNMYSSERYAVSLLTNILGGPGMNSILNVALREKRGLVYSVDASYSLMDDSGLFTVYFGCDPKDTALCKDIVRETIYSLSSDGLTSRALKAAKKQYLGQLAVASDNRESLAISTGRSTLFHNRVYTTAETIANVESITSEQICNAAGILSDLSSLTLQ